MRVDMRSPNDTRLSLARAVRSCGSAGQARCERVGQGVMIQDRCAQLSYAPGARQEQLRSGSQGRPAHCIIRPVLRRPASTVPLPCIAGRSSPLLPACAHTRAHASSRRAAPLQVALRPTCMMEMPISSCCSSLSSFSISLLHSGSSCSSSQVARCRSRMALRGWRGGRVRGRGGGHGDGLGSGGSAQECMRSGWLGAKQVVRAGLAPPLRCTDTYVSLAGQGSKGRQIGQAQLAHFSGCRFGMESVLVTSAMSPHSSRLLVVCGQARWVEPSPNARSAGAAAHAASHPQVTQQMRHTKQHNLSLA